ncbi:MAG: FtsX-like permease family protein, partial [Anaerovoracaceae bacterium]
AANEVENLQKTFERLSFLFFIVSLFILVIGLFLCIILLIKLTNSRYREIGLMSALGYSRLVLRWILMGETLLLSALAVVSSLALLAIATCIARFAFQIEVLLTPAELLWSVLATFTAMALISSIACIPLLRTEPAEALKK